LKTPVLLEEDVMRKEKIIEIKINDVTYIVSEENRDDDHLREIIKKMIIEIEIIVALLKLFSFPSHIIIRDNVVKVFDFPLLAINKFYLENN